MAESSGDGERESRWDDVPSERAEADLPETPSEPDETSAETSKTGEMSEVAGGEETAKVIAFRSNSHDDPPEDETDGGNGGEISDELAGELSGDDELLEPGELEEPIDLSALQADDALLDSLGGADPDIAGADGESVEAMLLAWRRDVDAVPLADLLDTEAAASAIEAGQRRAGRRKRRFLVPVASAAAVFMIAVTGVGLAAQNAMPGDPLWGVAKVLYADHARTVQAAALVRTDLDRASSAWDAGRKAEAEAELRQAEQRLRTIDQQYEKRGELEAARASLTAKFRGNGGSDDGSSSVSPSHPSQQPLPLPSQSTSPTSPMPTQPTSPSTTPSPSTSTEPSYPGSSSPKPSGSQSPTTTSRSGSELGPWMSPSTGS